jgi:uncharacterized protein (DUF427 family)
MKAIVLGQVLAEAPEDDTIEIEGNVYFPPAALAKEILHESETPYTCPWKGASQYYSATVESREVEDVAWSYPEPMASAITRVGRDFSGYVAFSPGVQIVRD